MDLVIDKAKRDESIKTGTLDMKNYIGFQYRLQVVEVLKMDRKTKGAGVVSVFVPMESFTAAPALLKGQKYVVLLDHLNDDPELFAHAMIHEYGKPALTVFQPKDKYVLKGSSDAVRVIPANGALIERIRQVVRSAPQQKSQSALTEVRSIRNRSR
jgi:hypothetical protein